MVAIYVHTYQYVATGTVATGTDPEINLGARVAGLGFSLEHYHNGGLAECVVCKAHRGLLPRKFLKSYPPVIEF